MAHASPAWHISIQVARHVPPVSISGLVHVVGFVPVPENILRAWSFDAAVMFSLVAPAALYTVGVTRLWRRAGQGRGVSTTQVGLFALAMLVLVIALISPLDALGSALFSAHMTQHQLLMVVAPPLLLLGAPAVAMVWALPEPWRRPVGAALRTVSHSGTWRTVAHPVSAFLLHAAAIWLWHMPVLYEQTLTSDLVHAAQHLSFTLTALLFWWTVLHPRRRGASVHGVAVLSLFGTAAHGSILAALLTFSSRPWYLAYAGRTDAWQLTLLEDQQLGGLIMWVPSGIVYTAAALLLFWSSLRAMERRDAGGIRGMMQHADSAP